MAYFMSQTKDTSEKEWMRVRAWNPHKKAWVNEYDPDCPTELLVNVEEVAAYEFNRMSRRK